MCGLSWNTSLHFLLSIWAIYTPRPSPTPFPSSHVGARYLSTSTCLPIHLLEIPSWSCQIQFLLEIPLHLEQLPRQSQEACPHLPGLFSDTLDKCCCEWYWDFCCCKIQLDVQIGRLSCRLHIVLNCSGRYQINGYWYISWPVALTKTGRNPKATWRF